MKKLISVLLTLAMVLSLVPAAFAADEPTITLSADKTSVAHGETVTLTLSLDKELVADAVGIAISFDTNAYTLTGRKNLGSRPARLGFTDIDAANNQGAVKVAYLQTTFDKDDPSHTSFAAGDWASFTFTAKEGADTSNAKFTMKVDNLLTYSDDGASQVQVPHNVAGSELTIPVETPEAKGYTVSLGADKQVASGQIVEIPVTIGNTAGETTYNAFDMKFSYDNTVLKLDMEKTNTEGYRVYPLSSTVRVQRYGKAAEQGQALTLRFIAVGQGSGEVKVMSACVDTNANAIEFDAPDAIVLNDTTTITVSGYTVTLPDDFTRTDATGSVIEAGGNLTFVPKDPNYDYTVTVTVGSETVTPTIGADGTYTVPNVNGNVVVTSSKTAKTFNVTLGDDTTGAATATYQTDYTFTLKPNSDYTYAVTVTIGGKAYTGFASQMNPDGTITGADITGNIIIDSSKTPKKDIPVIIDGSGAGNATGGSTIKEGKDYTFTVVKEEGYTYTISATMAGKDVEVTLNEDGTYTIKNVTGELKITITKQPISGPVVAVSKYVEMNNKTVFLVTVTGTPDEDKAFAYDGNVMYKTTAYGENVYSWLVIVDTGAGLTVDTAKANVTQASGATAEEVKQSYDVNETGPVDINDAQLTYDIYSGKYVDFEKVSVRKFLRADVTSDKVVNSADAVAIIANSK